MRELVAARDWLTVFQLPAYASELNPVESVWSHLKRSLANLAKRDIAQLTALAKTRLRRMQYRPGLIEGFLAGTRLDLTPLCNPSNRRSLGRPLASILECTKNLLTSHFRVLTPAALCVTPDVQAPWR